MVFCTMLFEMLKASSVSYDAMEAEKHQKMMIKFFYIVYILKKMRPHELYRISKMYTNSERTKFLTHLIGLNYENQRIIDIFFDRVGTRILLSVPKIVKFLHAIIPRNTEKIYLLHDLPTTKTFEIVSPNEMITLQFIGGNDMRISEIQLFSGRFETDIDQDHWLIKGLQYYLPLNRSVTELFLFNNVLGHVPRSGRSQVLEYLDMH